MKNRHESWGEMCRSLIGSVVEVAGAEWAVLKEEWERWGRHAAVLVALAAVMGILTLCLFLLGGVLVVVLFHLWLGAWWLAVLATMGVTLLFALVLGLIAWALARRMGDPLARARERWRDHQRWWREQVLIERRPLARTNEAEARDDER